MPDLKDSDIVPLLEEEGFGDYHPLALIEDEKIVLAVAKAKTSSQRRRGLLGRESLDRRVGLLLPAAPFIHSLSMKMSFDAAWIRHDKIVKVCQQISPGRPLLFAPALSCLELAAGQVAKLGLDKGRLLEWRSYD